jgi:hypothetical protein
MGFLHDVQCCSMASAETFGFLQEDRDGLFSNFFVDANALS